MSRIDFRVNQYLSPLSKLGVLSVNIFPCLFGNKLFCEPRMAGVSTASLLEDEVTRLRVFCDSVMQKGQWYLRTKPGDVLLPGAYEKFKDRFKSWNVRPDDIYVCSFPKNGTTWTQELVWLVQNDADLEKAKSMLLDQRVPFLEFPMLTDFLKHERPPSLQRDSLQGIAIMTSPRIIKTHLHLCLLHDELLDKSKVIVCLRNPKDTVVSYFYHAKLFLVREYTGDFPSFFDLFMDNLLLYSPYFEYVKDIWSRREHPNLCILFYEDMKKDLAASLRKVARFLGKELKNEEALVDHLSFKKMKDNTAVNKDELMQYGMFSHNGNFIRKGEVGDWKNYFTEEINKRMDEAVNKHFKPIGLEFQYE